MKTRTSPGTWRISEGRSIEAMFEGEYCQIASMNRSRWSMPDQDKNARLNATLIADSKFIILADHHFDALESALRGLVDFCKRNGLSIGRSAQEVLAAIDKERGEA